MLRPGNKRYAAGIAAFPMIFFGCLNLLADRHAPTARRIEMGKKNRILIAPPITKENHGKAEQSIWHKTKKIIIRVRPAPNFDMSTNGKKTLRYDQSPCQIDLIMMVCPT
jgi:hypothetical protein